MARLDSPFNRDDHKPSAGFDPIPPGWYAACITDATVETTKAGTGEYIKLVMEVDDRVHSDVGARVIFDRINFRNPNPKAVEIANQTLSSILHAIELPVLNDTDQLIGGRLAVKVTVRPATDEYAAQNECKAYDAIENRFAKNGATAAKPAAPEKTAAPPWKK